MGPDGLVGAALIPFHKPVPKCSSTLCSVMPPAQTPNLKDPEVLATAFDIAKLSTMLLPLDAPTIACEAVFGTPIFEDI
jgi:hypothetical protein